MKIGRFLTQERERYQEEREQAGERPSFEDIANSLFGDAGNRERSGAADCARKLAQFEDGTEIPTREEARRILRWYGAEAERKDEALAAYDISQALKDLADASGFTRKLLAERAGLSYHHFMRILNGSRHVRDQDQLLSLVEALTPPGEERGQRLSAAKRDLLMRARIEDSDPLWLDVLARKDIDRRNEEISRVATLRRLLRKGVGTRRWSSTRLDPDDDELERSARGPLEISSLAAQVVKHREDPRSSSGHRFGPETVRIALGSHFVGDKRLLDGFLGSVRDILESGVDVHCMLPTPDGLDRLFRTVERSLSFLGTRGTYDLRYFDPKRNQGRPLRCIISSSGRVLILLSREPDHEQAAAALTSDPHGVYRRHFETRFEQGTPLVRFFQSDAADPVSFQSALRHAETQPGSRFYVKRRLTNTMIPIRYWKWERKQILSDPDGSSMDETCDTWRFERLTLKRAKHLSPHRRDEVLDNIRREKKLRYQRHVENLNQFPTREIYSRDSFERLLVSRTISYEMRGAIIDQFLEWLEHHDTRYGLALVDDDHELFESALFGLHGGGTVFLSVWGASDRADYIQLTHKDIADAFSTYYLDCWNRLPEWSRNRQSVAEYLRALKRRGAAIAASA